MRRRALADYERLVGDQAALEELVEEIKRRTAELRVLIEEIRLVRSTSPAPRPRWTEPVTATD